MRLSIDFMQKRELYQKARKGNEDIVVIEGVHAFKHAARFGAEFVDVVTPDRKFVINLMNQIATEKDATILARCVKEVDEKLFREITTPALRTQLVALAKKPQKKEVATEKVIVYLENPRDIDNVGATVRVAAAADAAAVYVSGEINPWHVHAIRAGAGLQFALPVARVATIEDVVDGRKIYACDADGVLMDKLSIEQDAVLVFGTERNGISEALKDRADAIVAIPMREKVSSLNLATSVSAILYGACFK